MLDKEKSGNKLRNRLVVTYLFYHTQKCIVYKYTNMKTRMVTLMMKSTTLYNIVNIYI